MSEAALDEIAIISLKALLVTRGIAVSELATRCGICRDMMQAEVTNGVPTKPLRYRIERIFDYPLNLWTSPAEIEIRKRCVREFGVDPRDMELPALQALCRKLRTGSPTVRRWENWYELLLKFCRNNPERAKSNH